MVQNYINKNLQIKLQPFEFEVAILEVNQPAGIDKDNLVLIVDEAFFSQTGKHFLDLERLLIAGILTYKNYETIAASSSYSVQDLENISSGLSKVLSKLFREKVTYTNLRETTKLWAERRRLTIHRHRQQGLCFNEDLGSGCCVLNLER